MGCLHNREDSTWDSDYELSAFCFGSVGTKEAKGTGRSCPTIPTPMLLMATGFLFSRIRASTQKQGLGRQRGSSGTRNTPTVAFHHRILEIKTESFRTSGNDGTKLSSNRFRSCGTGRQYHFVHRTINYIACKLPLLSPDAVSFSVSGDSDFFTELPFEPQAAFIPRTLERTVRSRQSNFGSSRLHSRTANGTRRNAHLVRERNLHGDTFS